MSDIVSTEKRSQMMAGIKGKDTQPEILIRHALHRQGFRFRLHAKDLPGKPDLVFRKYNAVLFIHGCFWHQHDCSLFKWPSSNVEFWQTKLGKNKTTDQNNIKKLLDSGWRVGVIWECAMRGKGRHKVDTILDRCSKWIVSDRKKFEIRAQL
jgi:DNA mismatch endonuclease (patch repair protein)